MGNKTAAAPAVARPSANPSATKQVFQKVHSPSSSTFTRDLLTWYDIHKRDLPWRANRDPYRVWISEIMLQQTRVAAVLDHYRKFLKKFPNVRKLAAAREASVLAAWSGLGYYRRARMLHAAAKVVVKAHGGRFPTTSKALQTLPGIGRYTSAAIASIAFNEPVAVVDGNVERVLQRVLGRLLAGEELWIEAAHRLSRTRPGDSNQAIMELGATVCVPRAPQCLLCPISTHCATRGELPVVASSQRQTKKEIHFALSRQPHQVLLVQRDQAASLMPGMWELPELEIGANPEPLFSLRHSITVTDYKVRVAEVPPPNQLAGVWIASSRVASLPLTGLARKILQRVGML